LPDPIIPALGRYRQSGEASGTFPRKISLHA